METISNVDLNAIITFTSQLALVGLLGAGLIGFVLKKFFHLMMG